MGIPVAIEKIQVWKDGLQMAQAILENETTIEPKFLKKSNLPSLSCYDKYIETVEVFMWKFFQSLFSSSSSQIQRFL